MIKFRAWDAKEKQMLEVNHLFNLDNKQPIEVWTNYYEGGYRFNPDKSELMQYTGLKDVRGVEIYEWDIVEGGIEGRRSLIEMSSYEWLKQALEDEFNKTYCNYKIIGNKFQNPELLEVCDEL